MPIEPAKEAPMQVVVFIVDGQRFGTALSRVERVVPAVYITPLPQAAKNVCGVINVEGCMIPVVNMRCQLGLPERPLDVNNEFLILRGEERSLALWVDTVTEV